LLLAGATFALDLVLPLGVAGGVPYTLLVLLGLWSTREWFIPVAAVISTTLTLLGASFSPPGGPFYVTMINRSLTLLAIWGIALFLMRDQSIRRELEERREEARKYLELVQTVILALDDGGNVRMINRKGCELLGYEPEEIVGRNWIRNFLPERIRTEVEEVRDQLISGKVRPVEYFENPVVTREGQERLIAWHNVELRDERGRIVGTLSSGEDVTERKQAEDELRRSQEKLHEQEVLAQLGQMAAVIAHEVKNPLAGIGGALQIIRPRLSKDNSDREVVDTILERIEVLNDKIQELLQFSRPRPPKHGLVSADVLLQQVVELLSADPRLTDLDVEVQTEPLSIDGDAEMLREVFINLLLNAAQALDGSGKISLAVHETDGRCAITVADDGPGIPEEIRRRIFEPFFSTKPHGAGLGLATAKRVVEAHGGTISVSCPEGGGTVIQVRLLLNNP
jgi:PAS domain S-box-containing protein